MDDPLIDLTEHESQDIARMVARGYDRFWQENELTINKFGEVVRTDTPRRRPNTWVNYMNEDEREVRRVRRK
jgi:hypothetical protein